MVSAGLVALVYFSAYTAARDTVLHAQRVPTRKTRLSASENTLSRDAYEPCEGWSVVEDDLYDRAARAVAAASSFVFGSGADNCGVGRVALVSLDEAGSMEVVAVLGCSSEESGPWQQGLAVLVGSRRGPMRISDIVRGVELVPVRVCGGVVRLAPVIRLSPFVSRVLPWTHAARIARHRLVLVEERRVEDAPASDP